MFEDYDFGDGVLEKYIDFNIKLCTPINDQIFLLKEDMLQISYKNNYIIDIGWHPEFNVNGFFKIVVVKDNDWMAPVLVQTCTDVCDLKKHLDDFVKFIQGVINSADI